MNSETEQKFETVSARTAVFAGSFDPPTTGHLNLIERAAGMYDTLYVLLGINSAKKPYFSAAKRMEWLQRMTADLANVKVLFCDGAVVCMAEDLQAGVLVRGVRNGADFDYEAGIAWLNRRIAPEIETVLLCALSEYSCISSSAVRELLSIGQSVSGLVPAVIEDDPEFHKGRLSL